MPTLKRWEFIQFLLTLSYGLIEEANDTLLEEVEIYADVYQVIYGTSSRLGITYELIRVELDKLASGRKSSL